MKSLDGFRIMQLYVSFVLAELSDEFAFHSTFECCLHGRWHLHGIHDTPSAIAEVVARFLAQHEPSLAQQTS